MPEDTHAYTASSWAHNGMLYPGNVFYQLAMFLQSCDIVTVETNDNHMHQNFNVITITIL